MEDIPGFLASSGVSHVSNHITKNLFGNHGSIRIKDIILIIIIIIFLFFFSCDIHITWVDYAVYIVAFIVLYYIIRNSAIFKAL